MSRAFRLQGLLNLRQLQEEQAAGRLAAAHADLSQAEQKLENTKKSLGGVDVANDSTSQGIALTAAMISSAQLKIAENQAKKEAAKEVVAARQVDWSGARRKTATLEKLEDRHIREVVADELHKEQVVLDEIASHRGNPNATDGAAGNNAPANPVAPKANRKQWDLGGQL